jgi:hypothetical protein
MSILFWPAREAGFPIHIKSIAAVRCLSDPAKPTNLVLDRIYQRRRPACHPQGACPHLTALFDLTDERYRRGVENRSDGVGAGIDHRAALLGICRLKLTSR